MNIQFLTKSAKCALLLCLCFFCSLTVLAQRITNVHGTVEDEFGPLMSATVCEVDANGRVISSTLTDMNGNFSMKIMNPKDQLRFQYVGLTPVTLPIDKTTYKVIMESAQTLQEVTVTRVKRTEGNGLHIPEREVSFAKQTISMQEFEGLGITTIDEALQGRIAGLDIISLSGNLGSGSTMRLRGASSLSSLTNENPLIVVDGNVWEVDMSNFDLASSNEEKFAELLNINTEDIASINVLKDAAATAIYGSQGGNGVIELTTKRGVRGAPKVTYSLKLTGTYQPEGMKLLTGDDYTMMLKEAYFNPEQKVTSIQEINYDPTWSEYEQYNNNTNWRKAVTQYGLRQNHYLTISGGGERATFRISGGFDNETGSVICQQLSRFSTRTNLDYSISKRIRVSTNFAMTYTKNNRNSDNLIEIAQKKMPNMSIYEQDADGNNTDRYYNMLQSGKYIGNEVFKDDQRKYVNPVASAHLAKNQQTTYNLQPELVINYDLLGLPGDEKSRLTWRGQIYMNIFNDYVDKNYPSELVTTDWHSGHNSASKSSNKSVSLTTKHTLTFDPYIANEDHKVMALARMEMNMGSSNWQSNSSVGLPSGITSPDAGGRNNGLDSGFAEWRSLYFTFSAHYAYKERYIMDLSVRADGTTKFGPDKRWGYFPSVSLRWNVIDEPWMQPLKEKWLSMFSIRPGWGMTGHAPNKDYLYTSKYQALGSYLDVTTMYPVNLKLTNLKWQKVSSYNLGFDLGFFENDRLTTTFEIYQSTTSDMLMANYRIPSNTGFASVDYRNCGKMRNTGWEFYINTNRLIKKGKFYMDMNVNFGNNRNEILEMDESVLKGMNSTFDNKNGQTLTRVQVNNPFGAIYGFRSKGVYQYRYETFAALDAAAQQQFLADGKTAPVAINADGNVIYNENGNPLRMMFNYAYDGTGKNYQFQGGDAIYEDINHDGQINALDIVYLGSSLPKLVGGFGFNWSYDNWRLSTQFTYRVGNKILNMARLNAEAMSGNNNQSQAVNYRWRKDGDVTSIPRAMHGSDSNYNTLVSDRFVEDGTYLRMSYTQLSYSMKKELCKKLGVNKVSFYMSANNPLILTKYTGVDPDVSYSGYGAATDWGQTPRARSYTLGITVDF